MDLQRLQQPSHFVGAAVVQAKQHKQGHVRHTGPGIPVVRVVGATADVAATRPLSHDPLRRSVDAHGIGLVQSAQSVVDVVARIGDIVMCVEDIAVHPRHELASDRVAMGPVDVDALEHVLIEPTRIQEVLAPQIELVPVVRDCCFLRLVSPVTDQTLWKLRRC